MIGISIQLSNDHLIIKWQLSRIEIPISDIVKVTRDETYAGEGTHAIRIGTPYATTDRIVLKTKSDTYILFTTNVAAIENKITSLIDRSKGVH
ncbi:hypothetical protein ACQKL5_11800 [Peribacillus sp. NPDC097675]|uniref:SunI/YnzG family protein n=1 Tax=Peribacillus sp. NPDC097675 TaxID=3390618 RepID=UPI003CFBFF9E